MTNTDPSDIWVQTTFDEIQHYMLQGRKFLPYFEVHDILNQKLTYHHRYVERLEGTLIHVQP